MPDVLTHFLLGLSLALFLKVESSEKRMLIILGSVIVDIERPYSLLMIALDLDYLALHVPFHSLLGVLCLAFVVSCCFDRSTLEYWKRFRLILIGCLLHILADMTMNPWKELGVFFLYPLKIPFSFHLFWSGYSGYPVIALIILAIAYCWYIFRIKHFPESTGT
ncbi:MAG: metal-dependent hydrolase [Candidatus Hodarchaeales archaeon]